MKRLIAKLKNRRYRTAYLAEHVRTGIAFQIRAMREKIPWTQTDLGAAAGKPQNVISRLEDPDYGKVTLQTLLQIANAFDVALVVKFIPYSRFLKEFEDVSEQSLIATPFDRDSFAESSEASAAGHVVHRSVRVQAGSRHDGPVPAHD